MDIVTSPLSREVITTLFSDLQILPPVQRLVYLHIYIDYNRINLANICLLLRSLEKIWVVAANCPHALDSTGVSSANNFIKILREAKHTFGDPQMMTTFALSALFSALIGALLPKDKLNEGRKLSNSDWPIIFKHPKNMYNPQTIINIYTNNT